MSARQPARGLKAVLPVVVLLAGIAGAVTLATTGSPQPAPAQASPPTVKVIIAQPQRLRVPVQSQGVLMPVTEIELTAEVHGKIVSLHPEFAAGGRFKAGDVLASIAPAEYDLAIVRSETRLAEAKRALAEEQAAAQQAQREWRVLGEGSPTPLSLHEPQLQEARARLRQAEAELANAKLQRGFCDIRAPFSGRVRERLTGVGQFAEVGKPLGRIYADDTAEIRLPLTPAQAAYLQAPDEAGRLPGARVTLRVETGAQPLQRQARIVRREGVVDPGTGLEYWVARLDHPGQAPAILPGAFVSADIEGRERDGIFVLPQTALNAAQEALLVDADNRLRIKRLTVLRRDAERVLVGDGLSAGDRLIVSGIDMPVPGMEVVVDEPVQVVDESIR